MNCNTNQCCAPTFDNKRCSNTVINSSYHCADHYTYTKKLYIKYKQICEIAYNLNISQKINNIVIKHNHLVNCYVWLDRAYKARMKHRKYAFVPECYDEGHNYQFTLLQEKLDLCEQQLMNIYSYYEKNTNEYESANRIRKSICNNNDNGNHNGNHNDNNNDNKEKNKFTIQQTKIKIAERNENRKLIEKGVNDTIEKYIYENAIALEWRNDINKLILRLIQKICNPVIRIDDDNDFVYCVAIHNFVRKLNNIGYFRKEYEPEKCRECVCNNFITYPLTLGCSCVFHHNTVFRYFNLMSVESVKKFYEILLFNEKKIKPFIHDVKFYHTIFGFDMIFMQMELVWDKKKQRLVLQQLIEQMEKTSTFFASLRKKKAFRKNLYYSDSDSESNAESNSNSDSSVDS